MSNTYTKSAFELPMSREDAALLQTAQRAVDILGTNGDDAVLAAAYNTLGERFHTVFPPKARTGSVASCARSTTGTFLSSTR